MIKEYFQIPTNCPSCKEELIVDGKFIRCLNSECRKLGNLNRWIGALEIDDIGPRTIEVLYEAKKIDEPADFYKLTMNDFIGLERMGTKTVTKILKHLKDNMQISLPSFICGLNINNFSKSTAETLVESGYDTIEKMQNVSIEDLIKVKGIQVKTAQYIKNGLEKKTNVIANLLTVGITFKVPEKVEIVSDIFKGKSFCFTGKIEKLNPKTQKTYVRKEMEEIVIQNGGTISSVNKSLIYLVQVDPESTSGKSEKAKELGITILGEENFFKMLSL